MSQQEHGIQDVVENNSLEIESAPIDLEAIEQEALGETPVSEDSIDQAEANGQITAKQAQDLKKTLKIKVNGKEMEETIDFNDEESLKRYIQKAKAFDSKNSEILDYKSKVDKFFEMFQKDPEAILEQMGFDVDSMSEKRLAKKVEQLKKSPEQLERERMEKELEDLRAEKKKIEEEKQQAEMERLRNEQATEIESMIDEALSSANSILPKKNPLVLQRIASTMLSAIDAGYTDVTAKDVIPIVEKQWREELNNLFKILPDETIEALVTKERLDGYRKNKIASIKKSPVKTATAKQLVKDTGTKVELEEPKRMNNDFKKFFSDVD